jgi:folate-dependent tRNA-U54 methylase TrmFO/GidA
VRVNWYVIIAQAVEEGVHAGLTLAVDHDERGDEMAQRIRDEIMVRLDEVIVWEDV